MKNHILYYCLENKKIIGPLSVEELLKHDIDGETLIWTEGFANWTKIKDVPEVLELVSLKIGREPPPLPNNRFKLVADIFLYLSVIPILIFSTIFISKYITTIQIKKSRQEICTLIDDLFGDNRSVSYKKINAVKGNLEAVNLSVEEDRIKKLPIQTKILLLSGGIDLRFLLQRKKDNNIVDYYSKTDGGFKIVTLSKTLISGVYKRIVTSSEDMGYVTSKYKEVYRYKDLWDWNSQEEDGYFQQIIDRTPVQECYEVAYKYLLDKIQSSNFVPESDWTEFDRNLYKTKTLFHKIVSLSEENTGQAFYTDEYKVWIYNKEEHYGIEEIEENVKSSSGRTLSLCLGICLGLIILYVVMTYKFVYKRLSSLVLM